MYLPTPGTHLLCRLVRTQRLQSAGKLCFLFFQRGKGFGAASLCTLHLVRDLAIRLSVSGPRESKEEEPCSAKMSLPSNVTDDRSSSNNHGHEQFRAPQAENGDKWRGGVED